jgi:hypothetical protein
MKNYWKRNKDWFITAIIYYIIVYGCYITAVSYTIVPDIKHLSQIERFGFYVLLLMLFMIYFYIFHKIGTFLAHFLAKKLFKIKYTKIY